MRILYLDLDALSPKHLSCYGYPRPTSPTIDRLAAEGVRFERVYCSDAPCLPSRTAFYQGQFGIHTGVVGHGGTAADMKIQGRLRGVKSRSETEALPHQLQRLGYRTTMISPFGQRHAAHHIYAGYSEFHSTGRDGRESTHHVMPVVRDWLERRGRDDDWYLHVNFWDIHTPYRVPIEYGNPFEHLPLGPTVSDRQLADHIRRGGPHSAQDLRMYRDNDPDQHPRLPRRITDRTTLKQWIDAYDTTIRYVDDAIAELLAQLEAAGIYQDTAVIVSADHGECQGHLGLYGEHGTADDATCHIPLIVKWPGGMAGATDGGFRYHLDWAPTLLELLGGAAQTPEAWDGASFAAAVRGDETVGRDHLVLSQCAHVCQRSVRFEAEDRQWIYLRTYHDGFHPFSPHMLFDLSHDPFEQRDRSADRADLVQRASFLLAEWHARQMTKMAGRGEDVVDPLWTVMQEGGPMNARLSAPGQPGSPQAFAAYLEKLEATGRCEAADDLRRRYPV